MSAGLPTVSGRQAVRALEKAGFVVERISGSHHLLVHRDKPARAVTIPVHGSRDLKAGTLRAIIRQAGLSVAEFNEFL